MRRALSFALGSALVVTLTFGCAPRLMATGDPVYQPTLEPSSVAMSDGARLPLRVWAAEKPRAIIVGLHGMNDYSNAFEMPGVWFAAHGVTLNTLSPGLIATDRNRARRRDRAAWEAIQAVANPMGQAGDPDDLVGAALMLCSRAGAFITGADLQATGGGHL